MQSPSEKAWLDAMLASLEAAPTSGIPQDLNSSAAFAYMQAAPGPGLSSFDPQQSVSAPHSLGGPTPSDFMAPSSVVPGLGPPGAPYRPNPSLLENAQNLQLLHSVLLEQRKAREVELMSRREERRLRELELQILELKTMDQPGPVLEPFGTLLQNSQNVQFTQPHLPEHMPPVDGSFFPSSAAAIAPSGSVYQRMASGRAGIQDPPGPSAVGENSYLPINPLTTALASSIYEPMSAGPELSPQYGHPFDINGHLQIGNVDPVSVQNASGHFAPSIPSVSDGSDLLELLMSELPVGTQAAGDQLFPPLSSLPSPPMYIAAGNGDTTSVTDFNANSIGFGNMIGEAAAVPRVTVEDPPKQKPPIAPSLTLPSPNPTMRSKTSSHSIVARPQPARDAPIATPKGFTGGPPVRRGRRHVSKFVQCRTCSKRVAECILYGSPEQLNLVPSLLPDYACIDCAQATVWVDKRMKRAARQKKKKADFEPSNVPVVCDVCKNLVAAGGFKMKPSLEAESPSGTDADAEQQTALMPDIAVEVVCAKCHEKYALCSDCGGGGKYRTGKWRPIQLFDANRATCSLPHTRYRRVAFGYGVWHLSHPQHPPDVHYAEPDQGMEVPLDALRASLIDMSRRGCLVFLARPKLMESNAALSTWEHLVGECDNISKVLMIELNGEGFKTFPRFRQRADPRRVRSYLAVGWVDEDGTWRTPPGEPDGDPRAIWSRAHKNPETGQWENLPTSLTYCSLEWDTVSGVVHTVLMLRSTVAIKPALYFAYHRVRQDYDHFVATAHLTGVSPPPRPKWIIVGSTKFEVDEEDAADNAPQPPPGSTSHQPHDSSNSPPPLQQQQQSSPAAAAAPLPEGSKPRGWKKAASRKLKTTTAFPVLARLVPLESVPECPWTVEEELDCCDQYNLRTAATGLEILVGDFDSIVDMIVNEIICDDLPKSGATGDRAATGGDTRQPVNMAPLTMSDDELYDSESGVMIGSGKKRSRPKGARR